MADHDFRAQRRAWKAIEHMADEPTTPPKLKRAARIYTQMRTLGGTQVTSLINDLQNDSASIPDRLRAMDLLAIIAEEI